MIYQTIKGFFGNDVNYSKFSFWRTVKILFIKKEDKKFKKEMTEKFLTMFKEAGVSITRETIEENLDFEELVHIKNNPRKHEHHDPYSKEFGVGKIMLPKKLSDILFNLGDNNDSKDNAVIILLDKNMDILFINFKLMVRSSKPHKELLQFITVFDKGLRPLLLKVDYGNTGPVIQKKENIMSLADELFLIKCLYIIDDPIIDELFPELKVYGAYDFNSEEFKSKIEYLKLIEY